MPRGYLIFPMIVELGLLDTAATAADPDGAGPLQSGYDDEYREPVMLRQAGSTPGVMNRVERRHRFLAQVEDDTDDLLEMAASGNNPVSQLGLVFHYKDLEAANAVQLVTGKPIIKAPGARLISINDPTTGALIEDYSASPGYWATQSKSMGYGLGPYRDSKRNLLLVVFQERDVSVQGTST